VHTQARLVPFNQPSPKSVFDVSTLHRLVLHYPGQTNRIRLFSSSKCIPPGRALSSILSPQILAEAGILGLQVFHHIQRSRADDGFQTPLITTLYRDGYLYFAAVMSLRVLSLFTVSPPTVRISSLTIPSTPSRPRPSGICQINLISQFQRKRPCYS
jgi:hypothetical protein